MPEVMHRMQYWGRGEGAGVVGLAVGVAVGISVGIAVGCGEGSAVARNVGVGGGVGMIGVGGHENKLLQAQDAAGHASLTLARHSPF
jgi:hypothetical protein